jgi:hypothetical protein
MALSTKIKAGLNKGLEPLNLRVDTRTAPKTEQDRIQKLADAGQFEKAVLPVLPQFRTCDPGPVLAALNPSLRRSTPSLSPGKTGSPCTKPTSPPRTLMSPTRLRAW